MQCPFELATGSTTGREHLRVGKNNQDAVAFCQTDDTLIAVVCDGCGSGKHSEVGAKLGSRLTVEAIAGQLSQTPEALSCVEFWTSVGQSVLDDLDPLVRAMGGDRAQTIQDYFLFTILGVCLTPEQGCIFALGDGVVVLNEVVYTLEYAGNAPPYLGYGLQQPDGLALPWQIQSFPVSETRSLLVGTDGVGDLIQVRDRNLPGKAEKVGDLAQFWQEDRYFKNPDQIRRRLSLINRSLVQPLINPLINPCVSRESQTTGQLLEVGLLPDDTTFFVIRPTFLNSK